MSACASDLMVYRSLGKGQGAASGANAGLRWTGTSRMRETSGMVARPAKRRCTLLYQALLGTRRCIALRSCVGAASFGLSAVCCIVLQWFHGTANAAVRAVSVAKAGEKRRAENAGSTGRHGRRHGQRTAWMREANEGQSMWQASGNCASAPRRGMICRGSRQAAQQRRRAHVPPAPLPLEAAREACSPCLAISLMRTLAGAGAVPNMASTCRRAGG